MFDRYFGIVLDCIQQITIFPLFTVHWSGAHIFEQIWIPLFMKFQLEGFFLLLTVSGVVSFTFHQSFHPLKGQSGAKATFVSQPVNKEVSTDK